MHEPRTMSARNARALFQDFVGAMALAVTFFVLLSLPGIF